MFQNCSLTLDRNIILRLVPQILNLSQELTRSSRIPLLLHRQFIKFSIVWLHLFLRNRFFVIPQCLGNFLHDFLGRVCFSLTFFQINFELDLPIDSSDATPTFELRATSAFLLFPISYVHVCFSLRKEKSSVSCAFSLNSQFNFLFQTDLEISPLGQSLCTFQISISFSSRQSPFNTCN